MDEFAIIIILVRLLLPLLILRFPLTGILLSALADVADYSFTRNVTDYQQLDKLLDTYYLSLAAITVLRWKDGVAKRIALGAYIWRVIGLGLVLLTDQRWLLFAFPNFFEPFFVFYLLFVYLSRSTKLMISGWTIALVTITLLVPKLIQEYILHIYQPAPHTAPAWVTYVAEHFAWAALPLYILPLLVVLVAYVVRTKKKALSQKSSKS